MIYLISFPTLMMKTYSAFSCGGGSMWRSIWTSQEEQEEARIVSSVTQSKGKEHSRSGMKYFIQRNIEVRQITLEDNKI